ncbi:MAG: LysM peptidoglycan-binding domain-containing protein [Bacteroidetes bacterium]|nr:MAG: LysM peptidoglycan-binding domain-containing protein [Bacteroidota bacterium]
MRNFFFGLFLLTFDFTLVPCFAQPAEYRMTKADYVEKYKDIAIKEMLQNGIPASITLAQGILESDAGNSALAMYANNHFGIKCHKDWTGEKYIQDDDARDECFRKYKTAEESFDDHSEFLKTRGRYAFLFELRKTDYKGWADGLKEAGYATDKSYAMRLIKIIDDNKLHQYDRMQEVSIEKKEKKKTEQQIIKPVVISTAPAKKIFLNNQIKYVVVQDGDTYYKIAHQFNMRLWQLHNYNETGRQTCLQAGDIVYLQPKRRHSQKEESHTVRWGETMYYISQLYGIKMRHLYRLNNIPDGQEPGTGQKIVLKK